MRGEHQSDLSAAGGQQILVGRPCAARHHDRKIVFTSIQPLFHNGIRLAGCSYLMHSIVAGVASQTAPHDAIATQQCQRLLVLHEDSSKAIVELSPEPYSPRPEEILPRAEYCRYKVGIDTMPPKLCKAIIPKIVLYKENYRGLHSLHKPPCITFAIGRKIPHHIGQGIVFPHLVSRRREKCDHHRSGGVCRAPCLQHRPCLLELAKTRRMEPCHWSLPVGKRCQRIAPTHHHPSCLVVSKQSGNPNA